MLLIELRDVRHIVRAASAGVLAVLSLAGTACVAVTPPSPTPVAEIPVGGVREPITRENLAAARSQMRGGLLEAAWLPDGFELINVEYVGAGDEMVSVDLFYSDGTRYLHIWQTHMSPEELAESDPVPTGEPPGELGWHVDPLSDVHPGSEAVAYSRRLADGRTVSVDSDLDADVMRRVLASLELRGETFADS